MNQITSRQNKHLTSVHMCTTPTILIVCAFNFFLLILKLEILQHDGNVPWTFLLNYYYYSYHFIPYYIQMIIGGVSSANHMKGLIVAILSPGHAREQVAQGRRAFGQALKWKQTIGNVN